MIVGVAVGDCRDERQDDDVEIRAEMMMLVCDAAAAGDSVDTGGWRASSV